MNAVISARIATLVNNGMDLKVAIDTVLGAGTFDKIASDIWEAAQKRAA